MTRYEKAVKPKLGLIEIWVSDGISEREIAKRLGISPRTLLKYAEEETELGNILNMSRKKLIAEVENILIKKARGYTVVEKKTVDKGDRIETTETEKEVAPDLSAISFLLRNYCPEKWSDKPVAQNDEHVDVGGVVILPEVQ